MLQEPDGTSYTPSVHPLPWGMCHLLLEWATSAANFSPIFYHPSTTALPCLMVGVGGEEEKNRKQRKAHLHPWGSEISFEAILEVAMVMDNCDHWGAGVAVLRCWGKHWVAELWPDGCREHARVAPHLRKWLACSAHSPHSCKGFLMESQSLHIQIKHYLALLSMLWYSGRVLLPLCSNGPYNDILKKWTICLWGFWIQLIWRGAQFLLW